MSKITSARAAALVLSSTLAFGLTTAVADTLEESYWYASGDPTVPDGQLWVNSAGECWQSAYPDGPNNLPPCVNEVVPESITVALNFEFDKYIVPDTVVNTEMLVEIDNYIEKVKSTPADEYVTIVGHTDAKGSDEYNMALGQRRADAVRDYFIAQGYPAQDLAPAESMGKRDLLPDVDPFSVLQRRVVINKTDR
jgi:OOP family OmpA-OmpF porin